MAGLPVVKDETQVGDLDRDGVLDAFDEFPSDPDRSFSVAYPSRTGWGTVMYEDKWPSLGDYDFNDLVVDFRFTTVGNASGAAVDLIGDFKLRAAGGELRSGLAFSLPVASESIASVGYSQKQVDAALFRPGTNGAESTGSRSSIPVFSDAHALFGLGAAAKEFVNTDPSLAVRSPVSLKVSATFTKASRLPASTISGAVPDIFLAGLLDLQGRTGMRKEIHTLDNKPTLLADRYPFHELDDRSPSSASGDPLPEGIYYKDKRGAPWALLLPSHILYTVEKTQIASAYAHFSDWVYSGGSLFTDWYGWNKSGYADSSRLYLIEL
jgi:LruC domain-containing protein